MDGYSGEILHVDLKNGDIRVEEYPKEWRSLYIGGRGLGTRILLDTIDPRIDPFSPQNILVISAGPLTGTALPLCSRYDVVTKSPLTGTITSANSGGFFGVELKRCGFDAVVIHGQAKDPVYLLVREGAAELRDAVPYWGMTTTETNDHMLEDLGDKRVKIACIGPAGERLSRMASIMNDHARAAGRGGVGAVMGIKHLKAVAVRGIKKLPVSDPDRLSTVRQEIQEKLEKSGITRGSLHHHGTSSLVNLLNDKHILPTRNFQSSHFDRAGQVSGEVMSETILERVKGCYSCPVACGRVIRVGEHLKHGPEYETIWSFGPDCGVDSLHWITIANNLCNDLGLDTISTGSTIACAMEMSERGYIHEKIQFGDGKMVADLVRMIGYREGIGDELAEGSLRFARQYGHPEVSMSVKGQEMPGYDPRGMQGQGLAFATSVRGACHVYGNMFYPEVMGIPLKLDPFSDEGKAHWVKRLQDLDAVIDSSGICLFSIRSLGEEDYAAMLSAVTGFSIDERELLRIGERIWNLQKIFNLRAGFTRKDDTLPERILEESLPEGKLSGRVWRPEPLLSDYYRERGWTEDGIPTEEKLLELGIEDRW